MKHGNADVEYHIAQLDYLRCRLPPPLHRLFLVLLETIHPHKMDVSHEGLCLRDAPLRCRRQRLEALLSARFFILDLFRRFEQRRGALVQCFRTHTGKGLLLVVGGRCFER